MEQVSSFLENILMTEVPEAEALTKTDNSGAQDQNATGEREGGHQRHQHQRTGSSSSIGKKRKSDTDFSPFWYKSDEGKRGANSLLTDRLAEKIIELVIPTNFDDEEHSRRLSERMEMQGSRPPLSMNTMSKNAIKLNQRLTNVFVFIDNVINFFNWKNPLYTVAVLLVLTHLILNPFLATVFPIVIVLNNVLVNHYMMVFPSDSSVLNDHFKYNPVPSVNAIGEPKIPKPVPQLSKEFVLNLTDLQNHMMAYVIVYDFILWVTKDYLYFKDEKLTCVVYAGLLALSLHNLFFLPKILPILIRHLPIKLIATATLWIMTIAFHPSIRGKIIEWLYSEETRIKFLNWSNEVEVHLSKCISNDGSSDEGFVNQVREVQIFELQRLNSKTSIWESAGFTGEIYAINSPIRQMAPVNEDTNEEDVASQIRINKCMTINEVKPPKNYEFMDKNWSIDLYVSEWVENNFIQDLVNIDDYEKWVYDYQDEKTKEYYRRRRWTRCCRMECTRNKSSSPVRDDTKAVTLK